MDEYWDNVYRTTPLEKTGWYERDPSTSLRLLSDCGLRRDDLILDVGAGASTFLDHVLELGYSNAIAVDISEVALSLLRTRLSEEASSSVRWLVDDVSKPGELGTLHDIALWHDRAFLHFLLEKAERAAYMETLRGVVRSGGFVILAAFSLEGAKRCGGLPIRNYSAAMFAELLGDDFRLIETVDHVYNNRSGKRRPYVYARFQRD